jgi:hypothetical protein
MTPPSAGPTARARFWLTAPREIACGRSAGDTSSGCRVTHVGEVSAWPVPTAKIRASSSQGDNSPAMASNPSAAAASSMRAWVTSRNRRRSTRSPMAPASTANSTMGRLAAVWMSAT